MLPSRILLGVDLLSVYLCLWGPTSLELKLPWRIPLKSYQSWNCLEELLWDLISQMKLLSIPFGPYKLSWDYQQSVGHLHEPGP